MASHLRSISLPTRPHSLVLKAEEELQKLRSCVSSQAMCSSLGELGDLYARIEEIVCLPSNNEALCNPQHKRLVEEELDGLVRLLDLCSMMRDNLAAEKEQVRSLQFVLRRGVYAPIRSNIEAYIVSIKKVSKAIRRAATNEQKSSDVPKPIKLLSEAREVTISMLQSCTEVLLRQMVKPNGSKWSVVSRAFRNRDARSEEGKEDGDGDAMMFGAGSLKDLDNKRVLKAQSQLQSLEACIEGLENGLEELSTRLIQSRVSLLNFISL